MSDSPSYRLPKPSSLATGHGLSSDASEVSYRWPFSVSAVLRKAIQDGLRLLSAMRGCSSPPFWDAYAFWTSEFQQQVLRFKEARSIEHLEASDYLEDLLVAQHSRREEIARVTLYQVLLGLPPLRRRLGVSELELIQKSNVLEEFESIGSFRLSAAMEDPGLPPDLRIWLSRRGRGGGPADYVETSSNSAMDEPAESSAHQMVEELLGAIIHSTSLLPPPEDWFGSSCLDLRLENLSVLGKDHLAKWPDNASLRVAGFGLAPLKREMIQELMPSNNQTPVGQERPVQPWKEIVSAQRRIGWWIDLVRFSPKILDGYRRIKSIDPADREAVQGQDRIPDLAWKVINHCLAAYR